MRKLILVVVATFACVAAGYFLWGWKEQSQSTSAVRTASVPRSENAHVFKAIAPKNDEIADLLRDPPQASKVAAPTPSKSVATAQPALQSKPRATPAADGHILTVPPRR